MAETTIEKAEEARDLRNQLGALEREDQQQIIFKETSPARQKTVIYSMRDGEPVTVPLYQAQKALQKWDRELGSYAFTADKAKAPEYKLGTIVCFLHNDSPDQPVLQQIGLGGKHCRKATIPDDYNKELHAKHRHPREWASYRAHLEKVEKEEDKRRQQQQLDATLALAGQAAKPAGASDNICHSCGVEIEGKLADHQCSPS
jgi:hypothetical protein